MTRIRRILSGLAALALSAAGLGASALTATPAGAATTGCSVSYTVPSQWNTGFTANIVITNLGSPLTSWNLGYSYSGNQTLQSGWNGTWTQSGANVTVANASWNSSVATNGTVTIGANFNYSGTNNAPTAFTLNGVTCTGGTNNTGSLQASATTLSVAQSHTGTVGISLSAAPSANVTVSTARTSGNTGLSVSGGSSLTFTPSNFATAQNVTFAADSSSTGQATFTVSATGYPSITITVNETTGTSTGTIVATSTSLSVTQSTTGTVGISLSAAPTANVTVTTARTSGNTGLSVTGGSSLTFTPSNFATAQAVTFTADSSSTGQATFTVSATGYPSITITVTETTGTTGAAPQLHVSGNKLLNASGQQVILRGVNRSGAEYQCVQGKGIFDGEVDQAAVTAMLSWKVNAVRVPLNEACWNAESYVTAADAGTNYINAIKSYVSLLNSNGLVAILDLHWTDGTYTGPSAGCSSAQATCQKPMPDAAQAIPFWTSVASTFKGNNAVVFDLFNEPYASRADNNNSAEGWQCWATGSPCTGISYPVAGMQQMVNAVRGAGANNVIMLGGEEYSNDLTGWLANEPTDPDHNLVASWHSYNFNTCSSQSCWTSQVAPVIAQVPVVAGEIGENDCAGGYITPLTTWLDSQNTSYLAWAWNADFDCSSGPGLVTDYVPGDPTTYGAAYKSHLASVG
jgi:endoglucanase